MQSRTYGRADIPTNTRPSISTRSRTHTRENTSTYASRERAYSRRHVHMHKKKHTGVGSRRHTQRTVRCLFFLRLCSDTTASTKAVQINCDKKQRLGLSPCTNLSTPPIAPLHLFPTYFPLAWNKATAGTILQLYAGSAPVHI